MLGISRHAYTSTDSFGFTGENEEKVYGDLPTPTLERVKGMGVGAMAKPVPFELELE